ncbi:MITOFILIN [Salix purpurea]|uniref:MITOFILIN n=1 Tax=Salix purpurea TaxID=77065 RepID=A0A9Q0V331_SALPP|nr:MITOFILIN [Salix purpurea]
MHMLQGALALEDALYRGLPFQQELDALNTYLDCIDKDSLLLLFKEVDPCNDDIESIISRVEGFLAEGKLAKAVDALQEGVQGNQIEEIADDWVRRARNMAITEQALTVLHPYATCIGRTQ